MFFRKYTIVWLLAEAGCVGLGISYDCDTNGTYDWSGAKCVDLYKFETATSVQDLISSMNMSVNKWLLHYIYKRFKSINAPALSHLISILFIAIWHGLFPAYFLAFTFQVPFLKFEKSSERV